MFLNTLDMVVMPKKTVDQNFQIAAKLKQEILTAIDRTAESDDISQGEIARRIGAERYNVNKIMRRKMLPSLDFLLKMAEAIGLDVELRIKKAKS